MTSMAIPISALQTACMVVFLLYAGD
jgi:hypothetical protein